MHVATGNRIYSALKLIEKLSSSADASCNAAVTKPLVRDHIVKKWVRTLQAVDVQSHNSILAWGLEMSLCDFIGTIFHVNPNVTKCFKSVDCLL